MSAGDQVQALVAREEEPAGVGKRLLALEGEDLRRGQQQRFDRFIGNGRVLPLRANRAAAPDFAVCNAAVNYILDRGFATFPNFQDGFVSSLNFIGGEKGGVGKSVAARVLAQYFIDRGRGFTGYDTDRSHTSFTRFYGDYAAPVLVDSFESLDRIVGAFEEGAHGGAQESVIVDLAAQTAAPLAKWVKDSDLLSLLAQIGVSVNFWHLTDAGKDSVDLLDRLINTYGAGPNYFVVRNLGRGSEFSQLDESPALRKALSLGARVFDLPALHEASMRKIDRANASFWAAIHNRATPDALGMLERQRVKMWLKATYETLDTLPL